MIYTTNLFGISVEIEIDHHLPGYFSRDGSAEGEHLASQEPPGETDRVDALVVSRNGNVDVP